MNWFTKYIGVQGIIAVIFMIAFCAMQLRGQTVNPEFWGILGIIIGFYFAKNGNHIINGIKNHRKGKK